MRRTMSILVTLLICIVVFVLYYFLGKGQINKQIAEVEAENQAQQQRLAEINRMAAELPVLMQQLPRWQNQLAIYKQAIPQPILDNQFLQMLAYQLEEQNVRLLSVEVVPEGKWLGEIGEQQEEELAAKGIDPDLVRQVNTAVYSINLIGEYKNVLTAFENIKQYRRLYTIDEVSGPAGRAPGAISQLVDPNNTPIQITGRIYYGIPDDFLTNRDLIKVFESSVIKPRAKRIQMGIVAEGQQLLGAPGMPNPEADAADAAEGASATETPSANRETDGGSIALITDPSATGKLAAEKG